MKPIFILYTTLTILQVLDVSITGVSAATEKSSTTRWQETTSNNLQSQKPGVKTATAMPRALPKTSTGKPPAAKAEPQNQPQDEENAGQGQFIDGEEDPTGFVDSGKHLFRSLTAETRKRGAGTINIATETVKASSGVMGLISGLARAQVKNLHRVASTNIGLLTGAGMSLTNGAVNLAGSAQQVGSEGAKALYGTLKNATNMGRTATKAGGSWASSGFKMADDGLKVISRGANIGPKLTKKLSGVALNAMSKYGVESDEADEDAEEPKEAPEKPPKVEQKPKAPPSKNAKKPVSK